MSDEQKFYGLADQEHLDDELDDVVERVQDISEEDAASEGMTCYHIDEPGRGWRDYSRPEGCEVCSAVDSFCTLWDSINSKRLGCSWADNTLVWHV